MRDLTATDFVPLGGYAEHWRFTDFTYGYVSSDVERRVRPLAPAAAAEVASDARLRHPRDPIPSRSAVTFDAARDRSSVRPWLRGLPIDDGELVLVSWDVSSAVATDWGLFTHEWDSFCRDASDDVTIWAPSAIWTLCFWHYGLFRFESPLQAV